MSRYHYYFRANRNIYRRRKRDPADLQSTQQRLRKRYVEPSFIALIYAALGDKESAFAWLERGFVQREEDLALLGVDPRVDGLRSDPRFADLLGRIGRPNATNRRTLEAASGGRP